MQIDWCINNEDIKKVSDFVNLHLNVPHVANRVTRNVNSQGLLINRDTILQSLFYSLLLPNQKHSINSQITSFIKNINYSLQYITIINLPDVKEHICEISKKHGITLDINKEPEYFAENFKLLESTNWALLDLLIKKLCTKGEKQIEREIADYVNTMFKGFGAVESRIFLQYLGLTKYEIPIDSIVSDWLNNFGFPVKLSVTALQDRNYYHFVSNGIQLLCKKANVYPCVLEAAIHSDLIV